MTKELTLDERRCIRAFGGWPMLTLFAKDAKPEGLIAGGNSQPKGWGRSYYFSYDGKGVKIEKGYNPTITVVSVTWARIRAHGRTLSPGLLHQMREHLKRIDHHARTGAKVGRPYDAPEEVVLRWEREVWHPFLHAGELIRTETERLLDLALGNPDLMESQVALAEANAVLAELGVA